jgi:hypothetical protein
MSRTLNINAFVAQVTVIWARHQAGISMIEPLVSGGTRLVLLNAHEAAVIGRACAGKIMTGTVMRTPLRLRNRETKERL